MDVESLAVPPSPTPNLRRACLAKPPPDLHRICPRVLNKRHLPRTTLVTQTRPMRRTMQYYRRNKTPALDLHINSSQARVHGCVGMPKQNVV